MKEAATLDQIAAALVQASREIPPSAKPTFEMLIEVLRTPVGNLPKN